RLLLLTVVFLLGYGVAAGNLVGQMLAYQEDILYLLRQHIELVIYSGAAAILAGIPIGIVLSRPSMERFAEAIIQIFNVGTTIPTLAVLALSMTFLGIVFAPAFSGLFVASLLPIIRNTYAGLLALPGHLSE